MPRLKVDLIQFNQSPHLRQQFEVIIANLINFQFLGFQSTEFEII